MIGSENGRGKSNKKRILPVGVSCALGVPLPLDLLQLPCPPTTQTSYTCTIALNSPRLQHKTAKAVFFTPNPHRHDLHDERAKTLDTKQKKNQLENRTTKGKKYMNTATSSGIILTLYSHINTQGNKTQSKIKCVQFRKNETKLTGPWLFLLLFSANEGTSLGGRKGGKEGEKKKCWADKGC